MMTIIVGKVYANWCGHCNELAPKWNTLKDLMKGYQIEFIDYEEPITDENNIFVTNHGHKIKVNGYPTIFKIRQGNKPEYYTGIREPNYIKQWILFSPKKTFRSSRKNKNNKKRKSRRRV